jgi:hypothetical protein
MTALKNITEMIESHNETYGNVSDNYRNFNDLDDIRSEIQALLDAFDALSPQYKNTEYYKDGPVYLSAGAKVIAEMRLWYVQKIRAAIADGFNQVDELESKINDELDRDENAGGALSYNDYEQIQGSFGELSNVGSIHFGTSMDLEGDWSEKIALAVNQEPDYLDKDEAKETEKWTFNLKNHCIFWPTGLPLLPTPITPWVISLNCWYIEINGSYETFKLLDTSDETNPSSLFGHSEQIYVREKLVVEDSSQGGKVIGKTDPISFEFMTLNIGIIPPGKLPFSDYGENPIETE